MIDLSRVLVFGATGQLGQALCGLGAQGVARTQVDLVDFSAVAGAIEAAQPQAVINAAAYTNVDGAEDDEDTALLINRDGPAAMARAAHAQGVPFVHVSTDYVFDGSGSQPWSPDAATAPINAYGRTKQAGEVAVLAAHPAAIVVRTSWVFSATGRNFLRTMLQLSQTHTTLRIVDDQVGGPTPASALANACLALVDGRLRGTVSPGIYHYGGAPEVSWADFAEEIFRVSGAEVIIERVSSKEYGEAGANRPLNSRLDCTSFERATGLSRPDWRAYVPDMIKEVSG